MQLHWPNIGIKNLVEIKLLLKGKLEERLVHGPYYGLDTNTLSPAAWCNIDEVAEWLRRWTANPMCSARVGSNPILVAFL
jgi:hypothetical protein